MKVILTLCTLVLCSALSLKAADEPKKGDGKGKGRMNPEDIFKKLDSNNDGKLTKDEFMANPRAKEDPAKAEERWKAMSKGKDSITLEEFKAAGPGKGGKGGDKGAPKKPDSK